MAVIGYCRISTQDQNLDLQVDALEQAGAIRIFADKGVSGAKASRPELDHMMDNLREGDEIVVYKLDRIARNTKHLLELVEQLQEKGVSFRSLTEGISTSGAMGRCLVTIMGALAELERDQLIERTKAGLAVAARNNRHGGRPAKLDAAGIEKARQLRDKGVAVVDIARVLGISRPSVYRYLASDV